jgi:hypothetical protein
MHIVLMDITGTRWESDHTTLAEVTEEFGGDRGAALEGVARAKEVLGDFSKLNNLMLRLGGEEYCFNPANVVWIKAVGFPTTED